MKENPMNKIQLRIKDPKWTKERRIENTEKKVEKIQGAGQHSDAMWMES